MTLIKCEECDREISDKAAACPHCGCPRTPPAARPVEPVSPPQLQLPQQQQKHETASSAQIAMVSDKGEPGAIETRRPWGEWAKLYTMLSVVSLALWNGLELSLTGGRYSQKLFLIIMMSALALWAYALLDKYVINKHKLPASAPRLKQAIRSLQSGRAGLVIGLILFPVILLVVWKPAPLRKLLFPAAAAKFEGRELLKGQADEDHDKAIAKFTEAIHLDPDDADAYFQRGIAWLRKDEAKATADFNKAIQLDPKMAAACELERKKWQYFGRTTSPPH